MYFFVFDNKLNETFVVVVVIAIVEMVKLRLIMLSDG